MSETQPQPQFDALAHAAARAAGEAGFRDLTSKPEVYERFMENGVELSQTPNDGGLTIEEVRQGHTDMADYLEARPTRAPKHMRDGKGFDVAHYDDTLADTSLETKSLNDLVSSWAEAEDASDRTKSMDIQDEIERRILKEENMSDDLKLSLIDRLSAQKDALRKGSKDPVAEPSLRDRLNDVPDQKPGEGLPWENPQADDDFMNKSLTDLFDDNNPELPNDLLKNGVLGDDAVVPTDPTLKNPEVPTPVEQGPEVIKLPENLQKDLDASRAEYVRLSAKRSGLIFGRRNKKELAAAEAAYNKARDDAGAYVAEQMKATGNGEKEIGLAAIQGKMLEGHELAHNIYDARVKGADEKKLKRFYEFWARQGTGGKFFSRGNAVKGATMTGIGIVPGIVAGAAGVALLGPIAGALAGGYVGRSVARGLMGAKINKEADAVRVASEQRDASIAQTDSEAFATAGAADTLNTAQITESITGRTEAQRKRNRNRAVAGVLISAAAGAAGAAAASHIPNPFGGSGNGKITMIDKNPTPKVGTGRPTLPGGGLTEVAPVAPKVIEITPSDPSLPWTHMASKVGNAQATPSILGAVEKGRAMGFKFNGETVPGVNNDRILSVTLPDGRLLTSNADINGALDYIQAN
jgi:hypothetical protein